MFGDPAVAGVVLSMDSGPIENVDLPHLLSGQIGPAMPMDVPIVVHDRPTAVARDDTLSLRLLWLRETCVRRRARRQW